VAYLQRAAPRVPPVHAHPADPPDPAESLAIPAMAQARRRRPGGGSWNGRGGG
jgi:hypothetical protein